MKRGSKAQRLKGSKAPRHQGARAQRRKGLKANRRTDSTARKRRQKTKLSLGRTSDGISAEDWSRMHGLSLELLHSVFHSVESEDEMRNRLLRWLDTLEAKYGELPSIVATRAGFGDPANKERLLLRAYSLAAARDDRSNLLHLAHSLAEFYVDDRNESRGTEMARGSQEPVGPD